MKMCKTCMWVYHMVSHNPTAPCEDCKDYDKWQTMKPTNADRIRSMTNEELANMWCAYVDCGECPNRIECSMTYQDCLRFALEWLEQECEI